MANTTPLLNHKHLIVKANISRGKKTAQSTGEFLADLVRVIGMKVAIGPSAYYCADEGNRGVTASAIIETSHVVLHVWDEPDPHQLQFDLYSCQDFDVKLILSILDYAFGLISGETILIDRNPDKSFFSDVQINRF